MADAEQPDAVDPTAALDIDLFCLNCGYNLRGLSGDPIRCPECFHESIRADLLCPPREVQRRVRKMHRCADCCVLVASLIVLSLVSAAAARQLGCLACGAVALPIIWALSAVAFKTASHSQPGWLRVLARISAYGVLWAIASSVCLVLISLVVWDLFGSDAGSQFAVALFCAMAIVVAGLARWRRGYGPWADKLERLARNAVRAEQEESRRRRESA
jgi:hypothetical protein